MVPLSSFLGRTVFEKDLGFVKPAHDFQNISKAKSQNQWSFRICYHSLLETLIINVFANRNPYFCECKSTSLDRLDVSSVHPRCSDTYINKALFVRWHTSHNISPKIPVIQQETMDIICANLVLKKNLLFLCFIVTNKQTNKQNLPIDRYFFEVVFE